MARSSEKRSGQRGRKRLPLGTPLPPWDYAELPSGPGPPLDPRAAVFFEVVEYLIQMLILEVPEPRRKMVVSEVLAHVKESLRVASGARTADEQVAALRSPLRRAIRIMEDARPRDRRLRRESRGPDPAAMLGEYEKLHADLRTILNPSRMRRQDQIRTKLRDEYPELRKSRVLREQVAAAPPADAALMILGKRHTLAAETVRERVKLGRVLRRNFEGFSRLFAGVHSRG